jgi:hypothetical protein
MQLLKTDPALFPYTAGKATGLDALNDPYSASLAELERLYVFGRDAYGPDRTSSNPADQALTAQELSKLAFTEADTLKDRNTKLGALVERAIARRSELARARSQMELSPEVQRVANLSSPLLVEYNMVQLLPF